MTGNLAAVITPTSMSDRAVQRDVAEKMHLLAPTLREHWPRRSGGARGSARSNEGTWRNMHKLFLAENLCERFGRGNVSASPAWHAQAHTVSLHTLTKEARINSSRDRMRKYMFPHISVQARVAKRAQRGNWHSRLSFAHIWSWAA